LPDPQELTEEQDAAINEEQQWRQAEETPKEDEMVEDVVMTAD
jgi:hypothetical protein